MVREVIEAQKATDEARAREKQVTATLLKLTAKGEVDKGLNRTKLCHKPEATAGHVHTFIPVKHGLSFSKIPIEFAQHQHRLAKDEFRVLQAAWVLASHSGEFYGEDKLSRMAKVHPKNLSAIRKSLANRCLIRRTGRREHNSDVWKLVWNPDYYGEYAEREADCTEGSKFSAKGSKFNRSVDEYTTNKRREENQNTKIFVGSTGCRSGGPFSCDEEKSFEDDGEGEPVRVINFP